MVCMLTRFTAISHVSREGLCKNYSSLWRDLAKDLPAIGQTLSALDLILFKNCMQLKIKNHGYAMYNAAAIHTFLYLYIYFQSMFVYIVCTPDETDNTQ